MTTSKVRRSPLAGRWYPPTPPAVAEMVESWRPYLDNGSPPDGRAVAAIVPHAGWSFSGQLACKTISWAARSLGPEGPSVVAVLGGHLRAGHPPVAFDDQYWTGPLGRLTLAPELNARLRGELTPRYWEGPTDDNTIELQLPLVKLLLPNARVWPLRVAAGPLALALGRLLAEIASETSLLILASTDLTHYGLAYGFAPAGDGPAGETFLKANDRLFIDAALKLDPQAMMEAGEERQAACSSGAAAAAVEAARLLGAEATLVDYYSSAEIRPAPQSVGYAGILLQTPSKA